MRQKFVDASGSMSYAGSKVGTAKVLGSQSGQLIPARVEEAEVGAEQEGKKRTMKSYFRGIVSGEPSQPEKDSQLVDAATFGDTTGVLELLKDEPDAGQFRAVLLSRALRVAASNGHVETVKVLLAKGAEPVQEALIEAAKSGYADVVEQLIGDADRDTLDEAVRAAKQRHCQTLGAFGAWEKTPKGGHSKTLGILLRYGPNPA